ncbi:hypothetical protein DPMN_047050 [Dreissena polymorpha]|uniref:Uncharacterized protein n=1 Tax=Dreissena polymorpha TaxID=45954 RepID=A0A9D4D8U7_DREPO|nr:hypothetical protein DPMN_047050 [Dreissena polymorpha]
MVKRYPDVLSGFSTDNLDDSYAHLYTADCKWPPRVDVMYVSGNNITFINGTFQCDYGAGNASRLRAGTHVLNTLLYMSLALSKMGLNDWA